MQHIPQPHEVYRHFKGKLYEIVTLAEHSETGEMLVIYQAMYGAYQTYARPVELFLGKVDGEKYPDAEQAYRFEPVDKIRPAAMEDIPQERSAPDTDAPEKQEADGAVQEEDAFKPDPLLMEFLDADTYEERLNILTGLHHRITDDMINIMAMSMDIEVKAGEVEERYNELRNCILKLDRFEGKRLK